MLRLDETRSAINNTGKFQFGAKYEVNNENLTCVGVLKLVDKDHVVMLETTDGDSEVVFGYRPDFIFRKLTEEQYQTLVKKSKSKK